MIRVSRINVEIFRMSPLPVIRYLFKLMSVTLKYFTIICKNGQFISRNISKYILKCFEIIVRKL